MASASMTAAPRISVLLTSYNRQDFIAGAIESVLVQTFADFELVIVDDGSTDRTVEIAQRYLADPRVRLVQNPRNLGQFENRRYAATLARAPFLKYHDSDDLMYPHCLATMIEPLEREPRAAFALSAAGYWPGGPCPMLLTPELAYERAFLGSGLFHLGPASALFRAEAFRELGGFPLEGVASDYLFWIRACASVNVLLVPGDLYYYRVHAGQVAVEGTASKSLTSFDLAFARTGVVVWTMLNSAECPLHGEMREQAKRNVAFSIARGSVRQFKRKRAAAAWATISYSGLTLADWLRYLRPPRRSAYAGTPPMTVPQS
jgi:glycosyltransferase involved in cell wall biosynthesis